MAEGRRSGLKDVAKVAGVSVSSASMALSDSPRVSDSLKARVRAAAQELGYVPHAAGRALRGQSVGALAVVLPHSAGHVFTHPVLLDLLQGIIAVANEHDLSTIVSTSPSEADEESAYLRLMRGRRADGVIVAAAAARDRHIEDLARAGYPVVVVGRIPAMPDITSIGIDDRGGARRVVGHLIETHGAQRIAHISGPLAHQSSVDKRDGYMAALGDAGLTLDPRLQFEGDYTEEAGAAAARAFVPLRDRFDAIFAANDQMAVGALQVLREAGLDAPRDFRLVGYDDNPGLRYVQPALTTVAADMVGVGRGAAELLLRRVDDGRNGKAEQPPHTELPTEVIVRGSCGCDGSASGHGASAPRPQGGGEG